MSRKKEDERRALIDFMDVDMQKKKQACIIVRRYKHVHRCIEKSLMRYVA